MKSRSHRLPASEPRHDDWVDGSWTVDCVCGVNFDDGEEMVDCDECGVWVHTRCSRYVKSDKSFACDKCKSNGSEETEVAEFLVELPTKTLEGMDNPNPESVSSRKQQPLRLWANISMEERVHVQGVPGGEPGLFSGSGMSPVFGPELWKSTGYVPKKFSFRYNEFPCVGSGGRKEEEMGRENGQADNGAGVLFSLLNRKESPLPAAAVKDSVGLKNPVEGRGFHKVLSPRQKKLDGQNSMKKESRSVPVQLYAGKRKKEELRTANDQNVKKKVRTSEKEGGARKKAAKEDRVSKAVSDDIQHGKDFVGDQLLNGLVECSTNLASNEQGVEAAVGNDLSSDDLSKGRDGGDQVPLGSVNLSEANRGIESSREISGSRSTPVKEEVPGSDVGGGSRSVDIGSQDKVAVDVRISGIESQPSRDSDIDEANSRPIKKLKGDQGADDHGHHPVESSALNNATQDTKKGSESSVDVFSEDFKANISLKATVTKVVDASRSLTGFSSRVDKSDESPGNTCQSKREPTSTEDPVGPRLKLSGIKNDSEITDGLVKSNGTARSHSIASYQCKAVIPVVKSTSTGDDIMSKSSDNRVAATAQNPVQSKHKESPESNVGSVKGNAASDSVEHEEKSARPKKVKEYSMSKSLPRISESTKLSHTYDSKRPSDSKDSSILSSSKLPSLHNVASSRVSGECTSSPQIEGALNVQNKAAASTVPGKCEKISQSGSHLSSKGNVASMSAPASSNVPATLSDEELALLLHQELNSSPRVPRVPRMRHAGSLPQLTSPSATSVLIKRTSSGAGKDHGTVSRRRTKDFSREGSRRSPEVDNEAKKMDRKPSSDNRSRDSTHSVDLSSRREADGGLAKIMQSVKKKNVSSSLSSSGDANGRNVSSSRPSSRHVSDDDPRTGDRMPNRTLPGLLAEIMKEGKRMTYEELCNAVLPHWPHLRKHNGERYAYSSHSQAVLDCLRNRSEWARLVDRGPKTSTTRKRRKLDDDSVSIESEDNENRGKNAKDGGSKSFDSHQEDFPKGKRKTRKRRRLALQGRGIVRRRRRADVVSDDESESLSSSSEESVSSEEEIQGGGGTAMVGSEASASSDEVR